PGSYTQGIPSSLASDAQGRRGSIPDLHRRSGLGDQFRKQYEFRGCAHPAAAVQSGRSVSREANPHGARNRIRARAEISGQKAREIEKPISSQNFGDQPSTRTGAEEQAGAAV